MLGEFRLFLVKGSVRGGDLGAGESSEDWRGWSGGGGEQGDRQCGVNCWGDRDADVAKRSATAGRGDSRGVLTELVVDDFDALVRGDADDFGEGLDGKRLDQFVDGGHCGFCGVACWGWLLGPIMWLFFKLVNFSIRTDNADILRVHKDVLIEL